MIKLECSNCGRHFGEAVSIVADLICPNSNCKASTQFKVLTTDQAALVKFKFPNPPREPKKKDKE
jgi:hypothetical protein